MWGNVWCVVQLVVWTARACGMGGSALNQLELLARTFSPWYIKKLERLKSEEIHARCAREIRGRERHQQHRLFVLVLLPPGHRKLAWYIGAGYQVLVYCTESLMPARISLLDASWPSCAAIMRVRPAGACEWVAAGARGWCGCVRRVVFGGLNLVG